VDVGLHGDRVQGLIDPATPLEQGGEETAGAQLRDRQIQIAGLCGERLVPVPVA
jgi:hypothetical protein